jgi:DNA-binding IclR family transcriptional regulator
MSRQNEVDIDRSQDAQGAGSPSQIQSLVRGLEILSQFTADSKTLSLIELSRRTGLHRATIYRFVKTLEHEGYLISTGSGSYSVGPAWAMALYTLGSDTAFAEILNTDLRALAESSAETVALGVRRGDTVQIVHVLPPSRSFVPALPSTRLHPLHASWNVHCQILLAHSSQETKRRMLAVPQTRYTDRTVVDLQVAKERLDRILEEGVAYDHEEFHLGTCAVAVPLMSRGQAVAALALIVPVERFTEDAVPSFIGELRSAAGDMQKRLDRPTEGAASGSRADTGKVGR